MFLPAKLPIGPTHIHPHRYTIGMPRPQSTNTNTNSDTKRTPSRFQVLSPETAKERSKPSPPSAAVPPNPSHPSHPNSSTTTSSSSSSSNNNNNTRQSFFNRFRSSYHTLPYSLRVGFRVLRFLAPAIPIGIFFSEHVFQVMWVRGPSMTPYLNEEYDQMHTKMDMVLVNMWPWAGAGWPWERRRRLERGMIVTFRSPANPTHTAIKRVIGLPGDRIMTREPCMKPSQIVPFNHVWLEGDADDPRKSLDSNTYGPVSISLITGRVLAVAWPRWRWLQWEDWEKGMIEGDEQRKLGVEYRKDVRDRVLKGAVQLERPMLE